jgi:hypothetical protein
LKTPKGHFEINWPLLINVNMYKTSNTISESLRPNCDIAFRVETCPTGYLLWTGQTILLLLKKVGTFYKLLSKLIELHRLPKNYYCCSQYPPLPWYQSFTTHQLFLYWSKDPRKSIIWAFNMARVRMGINLFEIQYW